MLSFNGRVFLRSSCSYKFLNNDCLVFIFSKMGVVVVQPCQRVQLWSVLLSVFVQLTVWMLGIIAKTVNVLISFVPSSNRKKILLVLLKLGLKVSYVECY